MTGEFGKFIEKKRKALNKTLRGFATELEIAPAYMSDIEKGHRYPPDKEKLEKMAELLHMSDEEKMVTDEPCPMCSDKTKVRSPEELKSLFNRLSRIEGQVRGIKRMLEKNAYCPDVLIQVSAINSALNSFSKVLLANHLKSCVVDDIRDGNLDVIDELVATLQKLMR